ncbi:hypothetical protein H0H93_012079 [Arthromyces matolae]|nr:hypothetical protein H0H93_012079 [Arthromyces matolae]
MALCLWCHQKGQYKESAYCGKNCMNTAEAQAPNLLAVPKDHNIYRSVVDQFEESWRHNTQKPKVHEVFKVVLSTTSRQAYEQYRYVIHSTNSKYVGKVKREHYRASVETQRGLPMGNQCRRWHGSQRDCDIGEQSTNTSLCNSNKCGICGIIRTSYKVSKAQRNISFGR